MWLLMLWLFLVIILDMCEIGMLNLCSWIGLMVIEYWCMKLLMLVILVMLGVVVSW